MKLKRWFLNQIVRRVNQVRDRVLDPTAGYESRKDLLLRAAGKAAPWAALGVELGRRQAEAELGKQIELRYEAFDDEMSDRARHSFMQALSSVPGYQGKLKAYSILTNAAHESNLREQAELQAEE